MVLPINLASNNAFTQPITAAAFVSSSANPAASGFTRAASGDSHCWRNAANNADLCLSKTGGDLLQWNADTVATLTAAQTLSGKTLTSPTINTPTLDGFGAAHVVTANSATTNFGTALTNQIIIASAPATGTVHVVAQAIQTVVGVGCSAVTNSVRPYRSRHQAGRLRVTRQARLGFHSAATE